MVIFIYTYDILPGKREEFDRWVKSSARLNYWPQQPEVKSMRVLENLFVAAGSPQRMIILELDSMGDLERVMEREETKKVMTEFLAFATNVNAHYFKTLAWPKPGR